VSGDTTAVGAEARAVESGMNGWSGRVKERAPGCIVVMESILETTKATTILEFLAGLRGTLSVTFEEGTWAAQAGPPSGQLALGPISSVPQRGGFVDPSDRIYVSDSANNRITGSCESTT
jgi:hypothetical protein